MMGVMRMRRGFLVMKDRLQYFHVISRVVDRRRIFGEREKAVFRRMMRQFEAFSGVEIRSFCIMGNHFHLLVAVPVAPAEIPRDEIWCRMEHIYTAERMEVFRREIAELESAGREDEVEAFFVRMRKRMYDLSVFVKDLKQKFSRWYNLEHERTGTLWENRFKSVLLGGREGSLLAVAGYIEMNPVRAGIVDDPADYRWSSYGEASAGGIQSRQGISMLFQSGAGRWEDIERAYRGSMGVAGSGEPERASRARVRHFSDGVVVGDREFLREFHELRRDCFSASRPVGGFVIRGAIGDGLRCLRRLVKGIKVP
jgi:REP element-mobilizing transposase RayT